MAGGTLLPRIFRGFRELREVGLVEGELPKIHAAQAAGCAPVVRALEEGLEFPEPVKPNTIAKSIAIGNPADGFQVVRTVKATGGTGVASSDEEILQAMELLAETEGVFTEPAGGATLAGAIQLVRSGVIPSNESWSCALPATDTRLRRKQSAPASRRVWRSADRWRTSKPTCDRRRIRRR